MQTIPPISYSDLQVGAKCVYVSELPRRGAFKTAGVYEITHIDPDKTTVSVTSENICKMMLDTECFQTEFRLLRDVDKKSIFTYNVSGKWPFKLG